MLKGQRFNFGNYKLQQLMDAQMKYRIDLAHRTGRPLETISTPLDDDITNLEEELRDSETQYQIAQENPLTENYKNKVKGLAGFTKVEEETDFQAPDFESALDEAVNPQPEAGTLAADQQWTPGQVEGETTLLDAPKVGEDIQPDDTVYGDPKITKYDSDGYPLATEDVIEKPGHSVLSQVNSKLFPKIAEMGAEQPAEEPVSGEVSPDPSMEFTSIIPPEPFAPPAKLESDADLMLKNLGLLKVPPLKFKPSVFKGPKEEQFEPDLYQGYSPINQMSAQLRDWSDFFGGRGWKDHTGRAFDKEMNRIDTYTKEQKAGLIRMQEKNRQSNRDAWEKFKYDEDVKYKMAVVDQKAKLEENKLKFAMLKAAKDDKNKSKTEKENFDIGYKFQKLKQVEHHAERINAFKNAMSAPLTGSGDKDIIENLVKFIDPLGVIREGKVNFMKSALKNFSRNPDGTINVDKYDRFIHVGLKGGFLTPEDRKELLEATVPMMRNFSQSYKLAYDQYRDYLLSRGMNPNVLMPLEQVVATPEQYEGAMAKILFDYNKAKKEAGDWEDTRAKNPDTLGNKIKDTIGDIFGGSGGQSGEKSIDERLDEIKKKYRK